MSGVPALMQLPPGLVSLGDHEAHARAVLNPATLDYFAGGAADEISLRRNREAWDAISLLPRVLRDLRGGHTRVQLLGRTLAHPVLLAPVAYQRLAHPDGELASAYSAAAQGAGLVVSTQASIPLETIAAAIRDDPQRGPLWFQLYLQRDRGSTRALVERAEQAGYEALVLTVDAASSGVRDRERRAGFRLPPGISAVNLPGATLQPQAGSLFDQLPATAGTWADVQWLLGVSSLPVLLKGILHEADALEAARLGVAGIIVSNHGGRTLDTVPATAAMLPRMAQAVAGTLPLLVDGGIRRGTDVLKAMALGATAVLVGRPYIWGLVNAGAVGVAHVLRLLRDELEIAMALCGVATLEPRPAEVLLDPPCPAQDPRPR